MSEYIDYDQLTQGQTGVKMTHKGKPRAIGNRVLVTDMNFGEQKTQWLQPRRAGAPPR